MADRDDERLSPRESGESGAPSCADFSSFREMISEKREAARAEREAAAAEARVERETAAAEQRRLKADVYELKLQLAEERRSRTAAVQNGTVIGLDGGRPLGPMRWMGSKCSPSPARLQASTSSVPIQRRNSKSQVKQIKDVPMFDGTMAKFPAWKQNFLCLAKLHGLFGIFTEGVDVPVADETMSIAALQEAFPHENIQKYFIAWNILSRAIASNGDRDTLRHASSPAAGRRALVDTYSASTLGDKVQCLQSLTTPSLALL